MSERAARPGDSVSAEWINSVDERLRRIEKFAAGQGVSLQTSGSGLTMTQAEIMRFELAELNAAIQANATGIAADRFNFNDTLLPGNAWFDTSEVLPDCADAMQSLYLAGERHLMYTHHGAGQRIPIPGVQVHLGKINDTSGGLSSGSSATVEVYQINSGSPADSTFSVTGHDWLLPSGTTIANGTQVYVFQHNQSKRWYVIPCPVGSQIIHGKITGSPITPGGSGLMNQWLPIAGTETVTSGPTQVTVYDWLGTGFSSGDTAYAYYEAASGRWYAWKAGTGFPVANASMFFGNPSGQTVATGTITGYTGGSDDGTNSSHSTTAGTITVVNAGTYLILGNANIQDNQLTSPPYATSIPPGVGNPIILSAQDGGIGISPAIAADAIIYTKSYPSHVDLLTGNVDTFGVFQGDFGYLNIFGRATCLAGDVLSLYLSIGYAALIYSATFTVIRVA